MQKSDDTLASFDEEKAEPPVTVVEARDLDRYSIYTRRQKFCIVALVSLAGLFSPLSANIYFPAIPEIAIDLDSTIEKINLTVTIYMVFQAVSPTFWATICDVMGRRPVFIGTFSFYIGACIGLFFTHSYGLLMLFRCMSAFGSASLIAAGAGTVADISPPSERGGFMGYYGLGSMLGPCIGPLIGGLLTEHYYWQAMFMFLTAFGGLSFVSLILLLPETLRSMVGNGAVRAPRLINRAPLRVFRTPLLPGESAHQAETNTHRKTWRDIDLLSSLRPFRELDIVLVLGFNAMSYALFYSVTASTSTLFKSRYGLTEGKIGLCYLAFGCGCVISSALNGARMDGDFRKEARDFLRKHGDLLEEEPKNVNKDSGNISDVPNKTPLDESSPPLSRLASLAAASRVAGHPDIDKMSAGEIKAIVNNMRGGLANFPIEHARLRSTALFFIPQLAVTIIYGWTTQYAVHLSVPLICQFIIGITSTSISNISSTLLLDLNSSASASVTAANNLTRCSLGAVATSVIQLILDRLNAGWTFTMLTFITLVFSPLAIIEWRYGMDIRRKRLRRLGLLVDENDASVVEADSEVIHSEEPGDVPTFATGEERPEKTVSLGVKEQTVEKKGLKAWGWKRGKKQN